jgi:hypothetical protein
MAVNLFDANFYRSVNPDLASFNDAQAYQHLISAGLNEGRKFSLYVDLNTYRANNPDLAAAGLATNQQLYNHLSAIGAAEGRTFSPVFNANVYRALNPDLQAAGLNNEQLFDHFRAFGINEGRQASNSFSVGFYLAANPDLAAAGFNNQQALQHYVFLGIAEGRAAAPGGAVTPVTQTAPQNTGDPFPPTGTTLSASRDLGVVNGSLNLTDFVGTEDRNDYYRFVLANNSEFGLTLGALTDLAYVQLIKDYNQNGEIDDGDGDVLTSDSGYSSENANINQALAAGTYFIRVYPGSSSNTNYDLRLNVAAQPGNTSVDPGNTLSTALDIGSINGERNFKEFVGTTDRNDIYRFSLNNNSDIKLTLSSLTDGAYIAVIQDKNGNGQIDNGDGDVLTSDSGYSSENANINTALQAGTYFIRVYPYSSDRNTNYDLKISAQARAGIINNNSDIDISANIDPLTNSSTVNELPASADFGNVALNDANVSVIQEFTGNGAVELGNVASNQLPNTTQDLIGDALGIDSDFGSGFTSNMLDNANFNSTLSLL